MPITLKDVAALAGVSPVVVSRVLHGKAQSVRVSEATAVRVREAAIELNYRVNVVAQNLRSQQTKNIGVLHGMGFVWPRFDSGSRYFASLMDGLVEGAFSKGYSITMCPLLLGKGPVQAMWDGRFDGLIWYSSTITPESKAMLSDSPVPVVLIHSRSEAFGNRFPSVICDNDQGIGLAMEHLLGLGHRKIGYLDTLMIPSAEMSERRTAYLGHSKRLGLAVGEADIVSVGSTHEELESYLAKGPRHTALVTCTEELGAQTIVRAMDHGVRVPQELSVVGFDSTDYCNELRPALTAVYQPLKQIGKSAIFRLLDSIAGDGSDLSTLVIPCGFDIRGSTSHL